ncbi:MAG: MBL fold metallo-hydrolase [Anaerovibrio sp.]|uniref:MBL fold metallo-hydrolase n=1 Tax=Anaerovibrio sp. TaxID=1872532 RepID=UPI0025FB9A84|nr:MBL fold metallo-hydrolase [Anaerovibrio sp.]MCR5176256.1 MBL fold metallo-hydrolase [Anaerovibrio sp.]
MSYRLTVLVENQALSEGLSAEHGLSFFVETPETKFIFDCGHTGLAWKNAEKMGINLSSAEFVVLSHSHYDHAGGFPSLLEYCQPGTLYTGMNFWQEKFSYDRDNDKYLYKGCGFTEADLEEWGIRHVECRESIRLDSGAELFTDFGNSYSFETIPQKFVRGMEKKPDPFDDEICLLLKEQDGLCLVVGCSHQGILNITATVQERTGLPVRRIIGGIHLKGEGEAHINRTLDELKALGVTDLNLCHCSGVDMPGKIGAGSVIEVK